ncbi:phosphatase PAP2 family protein [Flavimarina sp. Hel_I_48]|uniref:phosphatase PAP2 family protein n=1 Tax=Flavimarina sp. Hel_I_48 TaxID=1392488 RepID=UPI0004DF2F8F|nr:phosphatase PAP2 family protein [Flavimarina sp. Hel_I_48]
MWEQLAQWDRDLFVYLNNLGIEDYDAFWIYITIPRHWIPLYVVLLGLFFIAFNWRKALTGVLFLILDLLVTVGFTNFVKIHVARLRPSNQPLLKDLIRVVQEPHNFSFFSGHAASSFTVTTFAVLVLRKRFKWIYALYLWPVLFVMSRILVGVHYPADILVGAGVGVLMAILFYWLYKQFLLKYGSNFSEIKN